jgi:nucleotide-binding universal stress UspA family protein
MLKSMLVLADGSERIAETLKTAMNAAQRLEAHINVLHVRADAEQFAYYGAEATAAVPMFGPSLEDAKQFVAGRARRAKAAYNAVFASPGNVQVAWRDVEGNEAAILASAGRVCDLVVISRPGDSTDDLNPATVNAALFETGRPVMVAPPKAMPTIGTRVAVAWNDSIQAARAVGAAMPFLVKASRVVVLSAGAAGSRASTTELLGYFGHYGVKADIEAFDPGSSSARSRGRALLQRAGAMDADLLVMGAYGQGRVMQFLGLGGATAKVISSNTMPLLMAH